MKEVMSTVGLTTAMQFPSQVNIPVSNGNTNGPAASESSITVVEEALQNVSIRTDRRRGTDPNIDQMKYYQLSRRTGNICPLLIFQTL